MKQKQKNARKQIEKNKVLEFQVGDHVRVKMSKLYSFIRGIIKNKNKNPSTIIVSFVFLHIFTLYLLHSVFKTYWEYAARNCAQSRHVFVPCKW